MQVTFNTEKLVKLIVKESVVTKDSPTLLYRLLHDAAKIIFYIDKKKSAISISFLHYLPFFGSFIFP